jgi:hypothetical protein
MDLQQPSTAYQQPKVGQPGYGTNTQQQLNTDEQQPSSETLCGSARENCTFYNCKETTRSAVLHPFVPVFCLGMGFGFTLSGALVKFCAVPPLNLNLLAFATISNAATLRIAGRCVESTQDTDNYQAGGAPIDRGTDQQLIVNNDAHSGEEEDKKLL